MADSFLTGNSDKWDALQVVDTDGNGVMGASQQDGEIYIGRWSHKPRLPLEDPYTPPGFPCYISGSDIMVTHENGTMPITGAPYSFVACGPGSRFVCGTWNKPAMASMSSVQIDRNVEYFVPYGTSLVYGIFAYGQSLSVGSNSFPTTWVNPHPDYILMPDVGPNSDVRCALSTSSGVADVLNSGDITGLIPMVSRTGEDSATYGQTPVETLCSSMQSEIMNAFGFSLRMIGASLGVGGFALSQLAKGTQPYTNLMTAITDSKAKALARGWRLFIPAIPLHHGESDAANAGYKAAMLTFHGDLNADIKAITGQAADVKILLAVPSSFVNGIDKAVLAMYELHRDYPDKFIISHPCYMLESAIDNIHLSRLGEDMTGEYLRKCYMSVVFSRSGAGNCLEPITMVENGANIDMTFYVPVGSLVIDTTTVSERAGTVKGFEFVDDSGATPTITSVTVTGTNTAKITLSAPSTGTVKRVRYGLKGHVATGPRLASERPRGNLRDSDAQKAWFDPSIPLYNWLIPFDWTL